MAASTQWKPFPHPAKAWLYAGEALKKNWERLHRGDCEPYPKDKGAQEAWRLFHAGKFREAVAAGLEAGGAGITAANKAQAIYANGVETQEARRIALFEEVMKRAEAQARANAATATIAQANSNLQRATAALEAAQSDFRRSQALVEKRSISQDEFEDAQLQLRTKVEEERSASHAVRIAQYELELAQAALLRTDPQAETSGDTWRMEIASPINGRVLRVMQESAGIVTAGTPLLEVLIFDFDEDIYGRYITVHFRKRLRDERHFPDLDALTRQMHVDVAAARAALTD